MMTEQQIEVTSAQTPILLRMLRDSYGRTAREITKRRPSNVVLDAEQAIYNAVTAELDRRNISWATLA